MGHDSPVELRLLGPIVAQRAGGEQLRAIGRQQKRLALLAHLVLTPGPHRRQTLLTLFWPELDESAGRGALRQALHHLRKSLGDDFFENDGFEEIRVAPGRVWCDAVELERAFEEDDLESVVGLYRGDLLSGVNPEGVSQELEIAVERARASVREKAVSAMRRLAEIRAEEGDLEGATSLARRALDLDPLDEISARLAITILDRAGDRAGAVALYRE